MVRKLVPWVLLLASVALNGVLLTRRTPPDPSGAGTPAAAGYTPAVDPPGAAPEARPAAASPAPPRAVPELGNGPLGLTPSAQAMPAALAALGGRGQVDATLEQEALKEMALRHQREDWLRDRERITADVVRDLKNEDKQRRELEKDVRDFSGVLGLDPAEQAQLARQYGPTRAARLAAILGALQSSPPDYAQAREEILGLYGDEDRLAGARGEAALLRFRQSQLESRTLVLGIVTAFAQMPWDELSW